MRKSTIVTDDLTTTVLKSVHDQVQNDIAKLSVERQAEVRAMQAEVDSEIAKVNGDLDAKFDIEKRWREASGLHHLDAENVLKSMSKEPVGKIVPMYGKQWVHTPFKTVVQAQVYVDALQGRVMQLSNEDAEITIGSLMDQRRQIIEAYKAQSFTNMSSLDLMKLSIKRLFQRGKNG